jgi:hypothetical protein
MESRWPCFFLKCRVLRGIAGYSLFALKDCGMPWNPSGCSNSGRPDYETVVLNVL